MSLGSAICEVAILLSSSVAQVEARVDLEVDVRPAARVARREDAREGHDAVVVGRLHAAQVVLVRRPPASTASSCRRGRSARGRRRRPRSARSRWRPGSARWIVSGTPSATVDDDPKLERMSLRTTPLWLRTSGPFEPSPGKGPAVSSGMTAQEARIGRCRAPRPWPPPKPSSRRRLRSCSRRSRRGSRSPHRSRGAAASAGGRACRGRRRDRGRIRRGRHRRDGRRGGAWAAGSSGCPSVSSSRVSPWASGTSPYGPEPSGVLRTI